MQVEQTKRYSKELEKLFKSSYITQSKIDDVLKSFIENPSSKSLDFKSIDGCSRIQNCHQIRISKDYRILFSLFENLIILQSIGTHNYIEQKIKNC